MIKITFDTIGGKIFVEGEEGDLLKIAQAAKELAPHLAELRIITTPTIMPPIDVTAPPQSSNGPRKQSMREFAKPLSLSNNYEKIAALAYHAIKIQGKSHFTVKEMSDWFSLCGFQKPSLMPVAMSDAKRKYEYVTSKGRDQWTITTGGENLIMDMLEKQKPA